MSARNIDEYLKIEHVCKTFGKGENRSEVLRDISLDVARGEYIAIIGHSGCGKSTLLNIVAGLTEATSGYVFLEGREVHQPGPDRAVVFQNHSLLPWLTVYDNVRLAVDKIFAGTKSSAERHEWTLRNLELVHMTHATEEAARRDLRRHEATRRHRARPRHESQGAAARRTLRRAGCVDARAPAG